MNKSKLHAAEVRAQICQLLRITDEEYSNTLFDAGIKHAKDTSYCPINEGDKTHSALFWAWFENQFAITDELFLRCYQYAGEDKPLLASLKNLWIEAHSPQKPVFFPPANLQKQMTTEVEA